LPLTLTVAIFTVVILSFTLVRSPSISNILWHCSSAGYALQSATQLDVAVTTKHNCSSTAQLG
jgi:hypothetical protein